MKEKLLNEADQRKLKNELEEWKEKYNRAQKEKIAPGMEENRLRKKIKDLEEKNSIITKENEKLLNMVDGDDPKSKKFLPNANLFKEVPFLIYIFFFEK